MGSKSSIQSAMNFVENKVKQVSTHLVPGTAANTQGAIVTIVTICFSHKE